MRVARWTALVVGVVASLSILRDVWHNYQAWLTTTNDPSAKDAYLTFLEVNIAMLLLVVAVTTTVLWLLRRRLPPRS